MVGDRLRWNIIVRQEAHGKIITEFIFYANYLRKKRASKETWRAASCSSVGLRELPEAEVRSHANCESFYLSEKWKIDI